MINKFNIIQEK